MASAKNVLHKTCSHLKSFQTNTTGSLHHQPKPCSLTGKSLKLPYICMGNLMTPVLPEPASTDPRSALPFFFSASLPFMSPACHPSSQTFSLRACSEIWVYQEGFKASKHIKSAPSIYSEVGSEVGIHPKEMKLSLKHCNSFDLGCPSGCHIGTPSILSSGRRVETSALDQLWCWFWELDTYRDTVAIHLHCELTITIALSGGRRLPMKRESTSHRTAADRIMVIIGKQHIFG